MKCEEFEAMGLDAGRDAALSEAQRIAAAKHVNSCPRCAALENSWQVARLELRALAADHQSANRDPFTCSGLHQLLRGDRILSPKL